MEAAGKRGGSYEVIAAARALERGSAVCPINMWLSFPARMARMFATT